MYQKIGALPQVLQINPQNTAFQIQFLYYLSNGNVVYLLHGVMYTQK